MLKGFYMVKDKDKVNIKTKADLIKAYGPVEAERIWTEFNAACLWFKHRPSITIS